MLYRLRVAVFTTTGCLLLAWQAPRAQQIEQPISELLSLRAGGDPVIAASDGGLTADYLGAEAVIAPREGDTTAIAGDAHVWVKAQQPDGRWALEAGADETVAYWTFSVLSFSERDVKVRYRHAGGLRVWAFGELIVDRSAGTGDTVRESQTIRLRNGITRFLFKAHADGAEAFFTAAIVTPAGAPVSYIANFDRGGVPAGGIITLLSPPSHVRAEHIDTAYEIGQTVPVQWTIDRGRLDAGVVVEVSVDNGKSWMSLMDDPIEDDDPVYGNGSDTATYLWTIPAMLTVPEKGTVSLLADGSARIRVWSQYATGTPADQSGGFSIIAESAARHLPRADRTRGDAYRPRRALFMHGPAAGAAARRVVRIDVAGRRVAPARGDYPHYSAAAGVFFVHEGPDNRAARP
jgi:hypothetical protein